MLLVVVLASAAALAQTKKFSPDGDTTDYVDISLSANKAKYVTGEPIFLSIKVTNISKEKLEFASVLSPTSDVEIQIYRPERFPWRYKGIFKIALFPRTVYKIKPGETRTIRYNLIYDEKSTDGFLSADAGEITFVVRMMYTINDKIRKIVAFPPVTINVEDESGDNAEAFSMLRDEEIAKTLTKGIADEGQLDVFKNVAEKLPDSLFAQYALYTISGYKMDQFRKDEPTTSPAVLEPLDTLVKKYPDFPLMDYVYYRYAVYYHLLEQPDEVRHWLAKLYYTFPESPKIRRGDPLFKEYYYKGEDEMVRPKPPSDGSWMYK
jgi:hypothetical protein